MATDIKTIKSAANEEGYFITSGLADDTARRECAAIDALTYGPTAVYRRRATSRLMPRHELLGGPRDTVIGIEPRYRIKVAISMQGFSTFAVAVDGVIVRRGRLNRDAEGFRAQRLATRSAKELAAARGHVLSDEDIGFREVLSHYA